jgi:DNA-binding beta-propeller fold protein YncE
LPERAPGTRRLWWLAAAAGAVVVALVVVLVVNHNPAPAPTSGLPLRAVGELALPGDNSRFDYASLDPDRGRLYIAHLGASEIIEVDLRTNTVLRTIPKISQVHGVLVVPARGRVYATATGTNEVIALDQNTGTTVFHAATGAYPDGLAYDPRRDAVWTTNESGGTETVVDATTGTVRGTATLGASVGNVAYDPTSDQLLVAVQGHNELAAINPTDYTVTRRLPLPGCDHDHGLTLDPMNHLAFVACDGNATLLTVDLSTWQITATNPVGAEPDVIVYDQKTQRLYVACESGSVTLLDLRDNRLTAIGTAHLADGAHIVAVDPRSHRSYYPIPSGANGHPSLLEQEPTS